MPRKRDWLILELWCLVLFNTGQTLTEQLFFDEVKNVTDTKVCSETEFKCTNGHCIPGHWHCNGIRDCPDGADENPTICNDTCHADMFTCENKRCIQKLLVCDRDNDCGDNSDEKDCLPSTCESGTQFACSENYCIASSWRCDGDSDCLDGSDEIGCKERPAGEILHHCTADQFSCGDHILCIPQSWVCDGDKDCPDGDDESTSSCQTVTCRHSQFQCSDRSCISGDWYCDGKPNCPDGSDEKNCTTAEIICDPLTQFACGHGSCISLSSVCDLIPDCWSWADEEPDLCGKNECATNNDNCSQICVDLPIGFRCECRSGYKLINNQTCDDVDECMEPGSCSQFCLNIKGGFECSCARGYLRDPQDLTRCKAAERNASLIFARRADIRSIDLDHREMTAIVNNTKIATALDFVFQTGMIFWSDVSEKIIYKAPIDEGNNRTVVIDRSTTSDGLAVDWIYNHIYWTDIEKKTIELANFEGNMRKALVKDRVQKPRAIAVNPLEGWMFWTDWGDDARIERAGMDGSHRSIIVRNEMGWPNGLTLDLVGKKLYWVDGKLHIIASCNYDGSGRRTVLYSPDFLSHPFSITTFEDHIYWTDWDNNTIFKANKFTGKDIEAITSLTSDHDPMAIHVHHPLRQPKGKNECQAVNGNCSHLCLPAPKISPNSSLLSCACPDGLRLLPDGLKCVENDKNMVAHTVLLDFTVSSSVISDVEKRSNLKSTIANVLGEHIGSLKPLTETSIEGSLLLLYTGVRGSLITVRAYPKGLVTVNIEYYKGDNEEALLNFETARDLETALLAATAATRSHTLTPIKRGGPYERYYPSADERLLEYDIDKLVFEARSPYQKVQIVHSKSLGNMLVLDELQNMSEADMIYTETLMQRGKENYTGKEIVILGGGDGGLLWELLKEKPQFVTMLELDDVVIKACGQHMRSICGNCLDTKTGDNYEIIIGDCVKTLKHMIEEGRQFDYVFGDLTDIPISPTPDGDAWDFIRLILNSSIKVLKPTGKFMTHGSGASCPESLKMFEQVLAELPVPITFTKAQAFVPSFFEDWVFYQVSFK